MAKAALGIGLQPFRVHVGGSAAKFAMFSGAAAVATVVTLRL
ncbi:hypothetical protein [Paracidovorax anthurii]|nr:hypothetical protein [Paracidovorax anthurii]